MITTTAEFIEAVRKAIHEDRARHAENLIDGGADDFAAYRESVGFIAGMHTAERILVDEYKRILKQDGDDSNDG